MEVSINMGTQQDIQRAIIEAQFTYQPPKADQLPRYQIIRDAAKALAHAIVEHAPDCADRAAALRKVREAVMTANAAIALEGIAHPNREGRIAPKESAQ